MRFPVASRRGDESNAGDDFSLNFGEVDLAAFGKDLGFGIGEDVDVVRFEGKETGDPFFVKGAEGGGVFAWLEAT